MPMAELTKKDVREIVVEVIEPLAKAIQEDFTRVRTQATANQLQLDNRLTKVEFEIRETQREVREVKADVKWMKDHTSELFKKLDDLITIFKRHDEQIVVLSGQMRDLADRVSKLEARP